MTLKEKAKEIANQLELEHDGEKITSLGKFNGLMLEALVFYDESLNGFAHYLSDEDDAFELSDEEQKEIGEGARTFILHFHYDGSIMGVFTTETLEQVKETYND